ncbi:MAG: DegV family protein [Chloroflexi bacterium]|nr:DegV family protein [Chloroflexota bacterium]
MTTHRAASSTGHEPRSVDPTKPQSVRVVTDSTADLPQSIVDELGITVVPLNIHFGDEVYKEGVEITNEEFYRKLEASARLPTTSQPSVGEFEAVYRSLQPAGIVSIHIAEKLSGTYNSARLASENITGAQIAVVDSQSVTIGLAWPVIRAARAAKAGASFEDVVKLAKETMSRVRLVAALETLEYLRRGGRIGPASAFLGSLLSIKPLIHVQEGEVRPLEKVRTQARAIQRLLEIASQSAPYDDLAVAHARRPEAAEAIRKSLGSIHPYEQILVVEIGGVVGTHAGPGTIGISGTRKSI